MASSISRTIRVLMADAQQGSGGSEPLEPLDDQTLRDAGYILVTDYSGVDPTGVSECSTGLQAAIDAAFAAKKPLWWSAGTYLTNKTLRAYEWQTDYGDITNTHQWYGAHSGARPIIKLAASSSGFTDSGNPRPVVAFRHWFGVGSSIPGDLNAVDPYSAPSTWVYGPDLMFNAAMVNIDVDTNENAGAIGVCIPAAQYSWFNNIKVTATNSYACFGHLGTSSVCYANLEGVGGQYGICQRQLGSLAIGGGAMLARLKLTGQTVRCIDTYDYQPLVIAGAELSPASGGEAWGSLGEAGFTASGTLIIIDGIVTQSSGIAFNNTLGKSIYLRNVYITGTTSLTKMASNSTVAGSGTWSRIDEYASVDQHASTRTDPYETDPGVLFDSDIKHRSLIDGTNSSTTDEPIISISTSVSAPPATHCTKHCPDQFPCIDNGPYVDVRDYGVTMETSDLDTEAFYRFADTYTDYQSEVQDAIDAAHSAGHGRVLIPFGSIAIGGPLNARSTTRLMGIGTRSSVFFVHASWVPTSGTPVMFTTDNDADGEAQFANFQIAIPRRYGTDTGGGKMSADRFSHIVWRQGRKSTVSNVNFAVDYTDPAVTAFPRQVFTVTDNGGGRHYQINSDGRNNIGASWRAIKVDGTTEPVAFYGANEEGSKGYDYTSLECPETNIEINGASNVRVYSSKREGDAPTIQIIDSTNVGHFGGSKMQQPTNADAQASRAPWAYYRISGTSDDIVIAGAYPYAEGAWITPYTLYDEIDDSNIVMPEGVAIYKRGDLDDAAMDFT